MNTTSRLAVALEGTDICESSSSLACPGQSTAHHPFCFEQIHIEVARHATDDFNLFHDKHKWLEISNNPFEGPIVMGYQLNSLIEDQIRLYREVHQENQLIKAHNLRFSNYQITFVNAVRPNSPFNVEIKKTLLTHLPNFTLGNRITIKAEGRTVLLGFKKETAYPLFLAHTSLDTLPNLNKLRDCSIVPDTSYFLKRKYMNNGCVKNFLSGSLVEQADYFDDLTHYAQYPEIFPCSLVSGALLEKAQREQYDFKINPMVYTSHQISVDRHLVKRLKNNGKLHILVKQHPESESNTLNHTDIQVRTYDCYGLLPNHEVLFRMTANLVPLKKILKNVNHTQ